VPRKLTLTRSVAVTLTSWPATSGNVTSPSSFQIFDSVQIPAGTYTVNWSVTLSGPVGANEANNFALAIGGALVAQSVNPAAAGTYPQAPVTVTSPGGAGFGASLNIKSWSNNPTPGVTYGGTISAGGGTGTAQLGPVSPGEIWAPAQVSVSCSAAVTTGTCQCIIYAGDVPSQAGFVDGTFSGDTGDTTDAISGRELSPGQYVYAVWSGGVPGATASLVVSGTRTAPLWASPTRSSAALRR
jgi:hypothetical protein